MTYKVLTYDTAEELEAAVDDYLAEGWKLHGGVAVSQHNYYSEDHKGQSLDNFEQTFAQAMVKD